MHFSTRTTFVALAIASSVIASTSSTPVEAVGLDLSPQGNATEKTLGKRGLVSGILCGIGLLNACTVSNTINTLIDTNNCGTIGNICPTSFANSVGTVFCSSGQCQSLCRTGFAFSTAAGGCINTQIDPQNCGAVGRVCSFANANPTCSGGTCSIYSCASGFTLVNGACQATNTQTDVNNCGTTGNVCALGTGGASVTCSSGTCQLTSCQSGYTLTSGTCQAVNTLTSTSNCGAVGRQCPTSYANGVGATICAAGICQPTACATGYAFDTSISACRPVTSDPNNCGSVGNVCTVTGGVAGCTAGQCTVVSCTTPYRLVNGICTTSASARARVKKSKISKPLKLCPGTETACPIVGSASFFIAQSSGFAAFRAPDLNGLRAEGGYECLDTEYSIESCGGCASMGEGVNCLQTPHSSGVGCSAGKCVVFSCEEGYKPNFDSTGCVRTASGRSAKRSHAKRGHTKGHSAHRH
ncbi:hypothetical protein T439DRAFT_29212 [Meredithblackwellia eburnea MCA 4105]